MKHRTTSLALMLLLGVITAAQMHGAESEGAEQSQTRNATQRRAEPALYLHVFFPRLYTDPPREPRRILTTKISLNVDLFVAAGSPREESISGRIEAYGDAFRARLWTKDPLSMRVFESTMVLDEFEVSAGGVSSGGMSSVILVLSRSEDYAPFLRKLEGPFDMEAYNRSMARQAKYMLEQSKELESESKPPH